MKIGNKIFDIGSRTYVMGILNVTPDSFSDGGKFNSLDKAVYHAGEMIKNGVDIIDVGGESTRPNCTPIDKNEEIDRVMPIIEILKREFDIPISIDTYKSKVAECSIKAGADMINDVWGFKRDSNMAKIAAKYETPCCIMHNRNNNEYKNLIQDVLYDLRESIDIAINNGVKKENIIIDPGIGFAKNYKQNLEVMNKLESLTELGYPVLLGTSRKSMIGNALNLPVSERVEGTLATTAIGILKGCDFIRVHDVLENKRACLISDAIVRGR
ncbi:dihydropteroate synthase [Clostridium tyrobutyricum]|jgi:dihydropteroate synthase|uniref:dihydropteroate synthase n=1 Tax=Clostridium tyrobutyricum TaxID=1519 RepID=UPI0004770D83|nr:dihydropteroate synthase [Clostridium tyrobutyricum]MBR9647538.1 dihydropteroate synthase [Clostridium tyrobutyricum]MBV4417018.1 dihydropteroate synthase [Clostridium tyrobutyricum]MBV4422456.1 dihydropteroate synthase [Clostridium tyrobutyricum]MBV4425870.1 dihydropteroate synthase [Clostridium tyrobutyricum]MBV4429112.1 dihydropteroate synthase [Clostridium tyrobutyricum]